MKVEIEGKTEKTARVGDVIDLLGEAVLVINDLGSIKLLDLDDCKTFYERVRLCDNYIEINYIVETWLNERFPDLH